MRKINILLMAVLFVVVSTIPVYSQAPGVQTEHPEDEVIQEAAITAEPNVQDDIDVFLEKKRWSTGAANRKSDGTSFFLAEGVGDIKAPRNHPSYISARVMAFEAAILQAKKQMVELLGVKISKEALSEYTQGDFQAAEKKAKAIEESNRMPSMLAKTKLLVHKFLDEELEKKGVDPNSEQGKQEMERIIKSSDSFHSLTQTMAKARILGFQVHKTFEATPSNGRGQVGVLCIHSDKLQGVAEAMWTGATPPRATAKKPIREQLPIDKKVLLTMYGVQQKTDENGNAVLVAFAQGQPATSSVRSINAAYGKAKTRALGLIRQFAGENANVAIKLQDSQSSTEFAEGLPDYENLSAYKEKIATFAATMEISGISQVKRWRTKHPLTGGTVVGVVCSWSPGSAQKARDYKKRMKTAPTSRQTQQSQPSSYGQPSTPKERAGQRGSYKGQGAEADEDSF